jgi:dTDP-4-amino-4,6-dideoxygalactose transaminase
MKLSYPRFNKQILKKVEQVLKSGKVNYWTGNECIKFEKEFSNYIGNNYAIALSNGSVALELSLKAFNLQKGDQVIVSPRSFIISASCVLNLGLKPLFADVDDNGNLSLDGVKKVYNENVKAIIIVHLNGLSCDMDPILKFVRQKKLFLIEDCSQAHGSIYKNKKIGSIGHISTWSFCQDKIISTGGEGGMVSTNDKKLWLKLWSMKDHGKNYRNVFHKKHKIGFRWLHNDLGSNYRMTEMQATIGREQLKLLDQQIKKRNLIAKLYLDEFDDFFNKYNIFEHPNYRCKSCPVKKKTSKCRQCVNSFYKLNLFLNTKIINQSKFLI